MFRRTLSFRCKWPSPNLTSNVEKIVQGLRASKESVSVAETSSGGLISASLLSTKHSTPQFNGSGVRLPVGISTISTERGRQAVSDYLSVHWGGEDDRKNEIKGLNWQMVYPTAKDAEEPILGTAVHALELAHAAKFNLGTAWGIGESGHTTLHPKSGIPAGTCFVAVAGPCANTTGVLRLNPVREEVGGGREKVIDHMVRFTEAAVDLMRHLMDKRKPTF